MKIYAITKGDYSDYHICALTTSKEKAKRLKKLYSTEICEASIEEFEDGEGEDVRLLWKCNEQGGNARPVECAGEEGVIASIQCVYVLADDKEHAEKKAHDMIAEYKARIEGLY